MSTTFLKPTTKFPTTRFATQDLTTFELQLIKAKASSSYNQESSECPLLSFCGPEDLLYRFIDPTLPSNNTNKAGQALFDGELHTHEYRFIFDKNFTHGLFFSFEGSVVKADFTKIKIIPVSEYGRCLTPNEIYNNQELSTYIKSFEKKFLQTCDYSNSFLGPLFFSVGYAKNYQNFEDADFIDISCKIGLSIPEQNSNTYENNSFFNPPLYQQKNIGFPLQCNVEAGFYEWLNIGATGIITPFINKNTNIRINSTETNNILMTTECINACIQQQPFVYFNGYLAAEELIPKINFLLGFSYAHQFKRTYSFYEDAPSYEILNKYNLTKPWSIGCVNIEIEFDGATKRNHSHPRIKLIYVHPITGTSIYKSKVFAGQCGIDIYYEF